MNVLLLGSSGQVGQAWIALSKTEDWPKAFHLITLDRSKADLSEPEQLIESLKKIDAENKVGILINAAAYTQVDQAESDRKTCRTVNAVGPAKLADFCHERSIPLIHYSTDYVYSGEGEEPHDEFEEYEPLNYYGLTKAEGDSTIEESGSKHLIFRTSWVYSHTGKNFVLSMLRFGKEREQLKIVSDQVGSPTYAPDLALYSLKAIKSALVHETLTGEFPSGVYHLCNSGTTSWHGFADEIFKLARAMSIPLKVNEVMEIQTSEYPTPAKRPLNSRLSLDKIEHILQVKPRAWQIALSDCMEQIRRNT